MHTPCSGTDITYSFTLSPTESYYSWLSRYQGCIPRRCSIIMAPHLHRKSLKKQARHEADYRYRWPTQQTLVESHDLNVYPEDEIEKPKSMRIKALEAVAVPLFWMNTKLEDWQDDIDQHVEALEARKRKRPTMSSASASVSGSPGTGRSKMGSTKPGKSTHPYDTGISRTETGRDDWQNVPNRSPIPWDGDRPRSRGRVRFCGTLRPRSRQQQRQTPDQYFATDGTPSATMPLLGESGVKMEARKRWWRRFSRKTSIHDEHDDHDGETIPKPAKEAAMDEERDLTAAFKPQHKWKRAKDCQASAYPRPDPRRSAQAQQPEGHDQEDVDRGKCKGKHSPQDEVALLHSKRSAQANARGEPGQRATDSALSPDPDRPSVSAAKVQNRQQSSRYSPLQAPRTPVSTTASASAHWTNSSPPKTPNQLFRLLLIGLQKASADEPASYPGPGHPAARPLTLSPPGLGAGSGSRTPGSGTPSTEQRDRSWSWNWMPFSRSPRPSTASPSVVVQSRDVSPRGTVVPTPLRCLSAEAGGREKRNLKATWIRRKDTRLA
ncbi:hypothetical protein F4779DRAFT_601623 [Xylariaceae sp. FL0662B]|nr:hypothetical protein F4779DRAFT_601623 [Xylariaceae sp. FL0662B]